MQNIENILDDDYFERMMTANEIRGRFLEFFEGKGHKIVPSAPMVVKDDPTLMFTNAGMNQFKDVILGNAPIRYSRIADSQKCLRVSGKHNDLEEVGHDTYHHTMFEMLGNWSFGDYFKKEAISWAWELLTEVYGIDKNRLYVTIFEGAPEEGLERDEEAASYWREHVSAERIINGNKHDNFWEMGETGPCGPCSEIHVDLRDDEERKLIDGKSLVNKDHPQVVEIWNLVFMQYNRKADGSLVSLPNKVIDTGMGLERLCMALQGKRSNYDTDVFTPLIGKVAELSGVKYGESDVQDIAMRVIADHVRTIAFSISDGQLPSNAKAGYVIRRILRRAVRYGFTFLGQHEPFLYKLLPTLIKSMGEHYPELIHQEGIISKVMMQEESSFLRTLETGMSLLEQHIEEDMKDGDKVLPGTVVFQLYDTYGFPTDLTELILREKGFEADLKGFEEEMLKQKERARSAAHITAGDWMELHQGEGQFVGYDFEEVDTEILRYREVEQKKQKTVQVVLSSNPFYAEGGGQVGDQGVIVGIEDGEIIKVLDTIKENNLPISVLEKVPENPMQTFVAKIDVERRHRCEANHSATHLLHHSLREVLGEHVEQKGSFVSDKLLRFDFSHFSKMTREELREVERRVNEAIRLDSAREEHRAMPIEEAKTMGAMAFFGEKYGEEVRVIKYGDSIELCGGTHVPSTGVIGSLRIISESSIAAGIRRIEAVTGVGADEYYFSLQDTILELQGLFQNTPDIVKSVEKMLADDDQLRRELKHLQDDRKNALVEQLLQKGEKRSGIMLYHLQNSIPSAMAKDIAFAIKSQAKDEQFVFIAGSSEDGKALLTLMLSEGLIEKGFNAGALVREAGKHIQGGGGGQPSFATAGGKKPEGIDAAIKEILGKLGL